jgi:hypothetical protein
MHHNKQQHHEVIDDELRQKITTTQGEGDEPQQVATQGER